MELRSGTFPKVHTILSGLAVIVGVLMLIVIIPLEEEPTAIPLVLIASGIGWYFATRRRNDLTPKATHRIAIGIAIMATFLLVWFSLGVGIIGADGDPANLMFGGVIAVGAIGTILARSRPRGMSRTLFAMALTQALVFAIALVARLGEPWSGPLELLGLNGFFVSQYVGSALLFRHVEAAQSSVT